MLCETQTETFFCKTKKGKSSRIKNPLSTLALSSLALSLSSLSLSLSVTSLNLYHFLFPGATNGVQCSLEASTPSALLPPPLPLPPLPPAPPAPPRSAAAASRRCSSMTRGVTLMMWSPFQYLMSLRGSKKKKTFCQRREKKRERGEF